MFRKIREKTPKAAGYAMPAEYGEHDCCWMGWPENPLAWRGRHEEAKAAVARLANTISEFEPVRMLVPEASRKEATELCGSGVELIPMPIDDGWLRDSGPTFLVGPSGELGAVDWIFNGWGDMEFAEWDRDRFTAERIGRLLEIPCFEPELITEGGALHVDGDGTVLCTKPTLMDPNRNPGMNIEDAERILCDYLGVMKVLWLEEGFHQDETGGHIDLIASFSAPGRVLHLDTDNEADPNFAVFRKNIADLKSMTDARDRRLEVVSVPQPPARHVGKRRLGLSYLNFYPANGAIVMPAFGVEKDREAEAVFRREFPDREIVPFENAQILFHGGGGIHCLTQQQPLAS